jgi:hypothetical protein
VLDLQWCPSNSTVFGAVTAGGRLELWDFGASTLRPVVQHASTKCAMTALLFAKVSPYLVCGMLFKPLCLTYVMVRSQHVTWQSGMVGDFGPSTLRPVVQHAYTKCAMTALVFAKMG